MESSVPSVFLLRGLHLEDCLPFLDHTVPLARLLLDNIPHIKAYWRAIGIRLARIALRSGAGDLDGTVSQEDVMHEAGSDAPRGLSPDDLERIIKGAGLKAYRRDSLHKPIEEVVA